MLYRKHEQLGYEIETRRIQDTADLDTVLDDDVGDDVLRLVFTACHPVLSMESQVALTLRLVALLELQASPFTARVDTAGRPVRLN